MSECGIGNIYKPDSGADKEAAIYMRAIEEMSAK